MLKALFMPVQRKVSQIVNVIFNAQVSSSSMGGGDKIVISIAKELQKKAFQINFIGAPEGLEMAKANIDGTKLFLLNGFTTEKLGFMKTYLLRILFSLKILTIKMDKASIIWSASDFLPDVLPGFWLKLVTSKVYWIGNMFLRARDPFKDEVDKNLSTILFFFSQKIALFLYKMRADRVCVLCQEDFDSLTRYFGSSERLCLISGGIDTKNIDAVTPNTKHFDACYIGRFHYQKGIPTLIKTWIDINNELGEKHLAIIGWGNDAEVKELTKLIENSGYKERFHLLGFMDREDKIKVLKSSLLLLFPSSFESWGVVVAEALGSGVPVIAFELKQIKGNFPEGVLWSTDYEDFVKNTKTLLADPNKRDLLAKKAHEFSKSLDWKYSAEKFINNINF